MMSDLERVQKEKERLYRRADDVIDEILKDVSAENDSKFERLNAINQEIIRKAKEIENRESSFSRP
jgi:hypothetical protein